MHAADTLITPDKSTGSPEQGQVTPAQSQGEKEWSHPADMDGWVKVSEHDLCRIVQLRPKIVLWNIEDLPLLAAQAPVPPACTLQAALTGLAFLTALKFTWLPLSPQQQPSSAWVC